MNFSLLNEFLMLAKYLNFSQAAKQLYIGQPVLSRHIAELERQLGAQLFIRDKHSVKLTVVGEVMQIEAVAIVARYEEALHKIQLAASGLTLTGQLRIGFIEKAVKKFFPELIKEFRRAYPQIDLQLKQLNISALTQALWRGDLDIGFTLSLETDATEGYVSHKIYSDSLAVVLRDDHPLAGEKKIKLSLLKHEPFIIASKEECPGIYNLALRLCTTNGFLPEIINQYSFPDNAILMVQTGIGIAVLLRHMEFSASPDVRFVDIDGKKASCDVIATYKKTNSNSAILPFLQVLDKVIVARDN